MTFSGGWRQERGGPRPAGPLGRSGVRWLLGALAATTFALLIATQNYGPLIWAGREISWWRLAAGELPVWYTWLALFPVIRALALRFPPLGPRPVRNLLVHILAAVGATFVMLVVATAVRSLIGGFLPPGMGFWDAVARGFANSVVAFLPVYGILLMGMVAWDYNRHVQERAMRESRLQTALARARLDSLRGQLHPHFLFNTLNAVSALMTEDVKTARKMISRLSELLRISLEEGPHEVTLARELEILDAYVGIQQIRFGDRLRVRYEVDDDARSVLVPRLLLQPLVENAIKHGPDGGGAVEGSVLVAAAVEGGELWLTVQDDGPGFSDPRGPRQYGIGLTNTRARLEQLYGEEYGLELENAPEGGAVVRIAVPARTTAGPTEGGR